MAGTTCSSAIRSIATCGLHRSLHGQCLRPGQHCGPGHVGCFPNQERYDARDRFSTTQLEDSARLLRLEMVCRCISETDCLENASPASTWIHELSRGLEPLRAEY